MEKDELLKRAEELRARCERQACLTSSVFLTPTESYMLEKWSRNRTDCKLCLYGGHPDCERKIAFFLPFYTEEEDVDFSGYIKVIKISCPYGSPGHRDYMGALLGMGVDRSRIGDIRLDGSDAYVFCLPTVLSHLVSIDKISRYAVRAETMSIANLPLPKLKTEERSFTVMTSRLDAVLSGMFRISRTEAVKQIAAGNVSLNYEECLKNDKIVSEGDTLSLRGAGKGKICENGGLSRKGRLFINAVIYK